MKTEEALRETNEYLENLFKHANAPIIVWDPKFRITRFNHAFEQLTSRSAKEVIGKSLEILFPTDMIKSSMELIRKAQTGERWETEEIHILRADGSVRIVLWNSATVLGIDGKTPIATIAQGQDITERKQAEDSLRETRDYLNKLLNYANAPIIVWNAELNITRFNHAFEHLTGYRSDEVVGKKLNILFPKTSSTESLNQIDRTLKGEYWKSVEIPILRKDGKIRLALWNSANILDEDGSTLIATIAQGQDITDRKSAEDKIKASLKEKESLLREIHHRVKNNLQLISSLLNLQTANVKNKQVIKLFVESQNRIKSMALIHEELYKSKDIVKFDFSEYIHNLMNYLFNSFGIDKNIIALNIIVKKVPLNIDKAVLCGLIINELVSNSLKYAFPADKKGLICIECFSEKKSTIIIVSDNGVGLPKQLDFRNTKSLGLQIVCALTDELDGLIELDKRKGTKFKIKFNSSIPEEEK